MPATMIAVGLALASRAASPSDSIAALKRSVSETILDSPESLESCAGSPNLGAMVASSAVSLHDASCASTSGPIFPDSTPELQETVPAAPSRTCSASSSASIESCPLDILFYATQLAGSASTTKTDLEVSAVSLEERLPRLTENALSAQEHEAMAALLSPQYASFADALAIASTATLTTPIVQASVGLEMSSADGKGQKMMLAAENLLALMVRSGSDGTDEGCKQEPREEEGDATNDEDYMAENVYYAQQTSSGYVDEGGFFVPYDGSLAVSPQPIHGFSYSGENVDGQPTYNATSSTVEMSPSAQYFIPKMSTALQQQPYLRATRKSTKKRTHSAAAFADADADYDLHDDDDASVASPTDSDSESDAAPRTTSRARTSATASAVGGNSRLSLAGATTKASRRYECRTCQRTFSRLFNLKSHLQTHDPGRTKSFTCEVCGVGFCRQQDLQRHGTVHDKSKALVCPVCPGKSFSRKDALRRHIRINGCCDVSALDSM